MSGFLHQDLLLPSRWREPTSSSTSGWFGIDASVARAERAELVAAHAVEALDPDVAKRLRHLTEVRHVVVVIEPVPILARRIHQVAATRWVIASGGAARSS